ncbi:MAG TPA: TetR family transcriptional regulator [Thermoleophilaceae bacterium]|nr:TetR family transcriptional regulator [Thermoleophilaceae bacterium]
MMAETVTPSTTSELAAGPSVRERRRARTRDHIEAVALDLFLEYGYDATTVEEIAEAALISPRTFFRYFSSKDDLLLARGRDEMTIAARSLAERPEGEPVIESLRAVLDVFASLHRVDRPRQLAWIRLVTSTPHLAAAFLEMLHGMERLLCEFVAERLGLATSDRCARLVAAAFGTAFRVAAETWHDSDGTEDMPALVRENLETLVTPLLAPDGGAVAPDARAVEPGGGAVEPAARA